MMTSKCIVDIFVMCLISSWMAHAVHGALDFEQHIRQAEKRSLNAWVSINYDGNWPCSLEHLRTIYTAVEYAKILANGAVVALEESGATSSAYRRWFGGQNAKRSTLEAIKIHHYEAVLAGLRGPESGSVKFVETGGPDSERLVYSCPALDDAQCVSGEAAAVINFGDEGLKVNLIYLCPQFFNKASHSEMLRNWRKGLYTPSAGLILLHEMQHLDSIVGSNRRTLDYAYSVTAYVLSLKRVFGETFTEMGNILTSMISVARVSTMETRHLTHRTLHFMPWTYWQVHQPRTTLDQ
ncbi:hypothetical protein C8034_v009844 [Colletotrichum sidae]|uniref:Lysine-specific metallo-endopeptidase domain-containing protein n=1 Tax=Colletotrichum sidae TaxID=1347389 RepID=A0A4R8T1X9_9PEZI|nr:hypothetical protein C8034_v009844 [Colletotrichum sidae]